ncbi:hypothetical protein Aca07nite_61430 [Actinoplanes capillaceus]|uniref:Peptidase inhibitor family I36 n=1 Tax=Actinoplanes campanulatus TaxID=113559 RepID=A0ABQ3WRE9_9ACTN|nr:hypothetical protein [Actinoplanes capillaceus]GID48868.1 hypothetical protein Aca07nite_61430 [Actinoplanes capillaceus]
MNRRMSSRTVSLTSTFLLLAAGGTAACDNDEYVDEGFYCADANGVIVDEDYCDDDGGGGGGGSSFFIWHSAGYRSNYLVGQKLPSGGSKFAYNDAASRAKFGLPSTGRISNGTVKTSVVGKGGSGSSSRSGG